MLKEINKKIDEILKIVNKCPENLKEVCFEILLNSEVEIAMKGLEVEVKKEGKNTTLQEDIVEDVIDSVTPVKDSGDEIQLTDLHVKARKFLDSEVTLVHINNIFYKNGNEYMQLFDDLKTTKAKESQIRLSLIEALKNAMTNGDYIFDPEKIRSDCDAFKCYDAANFSKNFKLEKVLFKEDYKKGQTMSLTAEGKKKLKEIVIELGQ